MIRRLLPAALAALVLATPVEAKRVMIAYTPLQKFLRAEVVVVGKVTAIEKDAVETTPAPGVKEKQTYKVAVIKVETALAGADNVTHIKVGFLPPPPGQRPEPPAVGPGRPAPIRGGFGPVYLSEGQEGLFYLTKHHTGEFYTINPLLAPTGAKDDGYKEQLETVKKAVATLADPAKALKAEKAEERFFAAGVMVTKYRTYPENPTGRPVETVKVPAEESRLILKALTEGDWKGPAKDGYGFNGHALFGQLGLTDKDGWKYPMVKPNEDFVTVTKEAFVKWLDGPGKDYRINRVVLKK